VSLTGTDLAKQLKEKGSDHNLILEEEVKRRLKLGL
jgi:hypothetical protein